MSAMTRTARRGRLSATALAFAVAVLWAGPAQAGTPIQLGQLSQGDPGTCGRVTNLVQAAVAGPPSYTVPSDGVITSWSHRGNDIAPGTGRLQLWRPAGGTNYTLVGRSEIEAFVAGVVDTFATDIPVSTGDVLGFRSDTAGTGCTGAGGVGDVVRFDGANTSDPPPGVMRDMFDAETPFRLNVSATFASDSPPSPPPPDSTPPDTTNPKAKISKVSVKGPAKPKKGKKATYKVKVSNPGNIDAAGAKLQVKGKGVKAKKSVGKISAGKAKTVKLKLKLKKPGKVKLTFKVTSENAGGKSVKKTVKVKK
jgi:hypothetical protein